MRFVLHMERRMQAARLRQGFSLVEVVLALGLVSVCVLAMLGVMSVGLNTLKDSSDQTMHAQIISEVSSSVLQAPFDEIGKLAALSPLYFDGAGRKCAEAGEAIYQVQLENIDGGNYPGVPEGIEDALRTVRITVLTQPPGASSPLSTSSTCLVVPRS